LEDAYDAFNSLVGAIQISEGNIALYLLTSLAPITCEGATASNTAAERKYTMPSEAATATAINQATCSVREDRNIQFVEGWPSDLYISQPHKPGLVWLIEEVFSGRQKSRRAVAKKTEAAGGQGPVFEVHQRTNSGPVHTRPLSDMINF
jgi:hypothetical protein